MPFVTVVMSVKNGEATLERSVNSILNQTFHDFEFIIVDDYSTDATSQILSSYTDARIKVLKAPKPGLVNALNYGLNCVNGKYIARMDADDFAYPNRLQLQVNMLNNEPDIGVVSGLVNHVSTTHNQKGYAEHVKQINAIISPNDHFVNRFKDAPLANPSATFRSSLLKFGNYKDFEGPEDFEFWLRLFHNGVQFKKLGETILDWYDYGTRLTRTNTNYSTDTFAKTKAIYFAKWWKENHQQRELWIWGYGKDVFNKSKWLEEYGVIITGYLDLQERPKATRNVRPYNQVNLSEVFTLIYVADRKGQQKINTWMQKHKLKPSEHFYFMT